MWTGKVWKALYKPRGEMLCHYHLTGTPLPALISHLLLYIALRAHITGLKCPSMFPLASAPSLSAMLAGARLVCKLQGCCPCVVLPVSVCMWSVYVNPSHFGPEPVWRHCPRLLQANRILSGLCQAFHSGLDVVWAWLIWQHPLFNLLVTKGSYNAISSRPQVMV